MIAGAGAFFVKPAAAAELWLRKGTHQPNTLEVNGNVPMGINHHQTTENFSLFLNVGHRCTYMSYHVSNRLILMTINGPLLILFYFFKGGLNKK